VQERILARKCLDRAESIEAYKQEVNNLKILRRNILRHERIMTHLGTLETGHDFNILFNWADYDLHTFLHSERELNNPFRSALLQEASNLAGALHFLHNHIKDGRKVKCYHMDLKPENILVLDGNHPVGKWMIADFGISAFHPDTGVINMRRGKDDDAHSVHEESKTTARRYRGKCQPPEVDHSWPKRKEGINSKGDIWSYGCILAMVFAFSLRGKDSVAELDAARTGDGLGGEQPQDFFYVMNDMGQMILKPEISDWLKLKSRIKLEWVHRCVDLIQRILHPNLESRPNADVIERELSEISEMSLDQTAVAVRKPATQSAMDGSHVGHGPSPPTHKRALTLGSRDRAKITRSFHGRGQRNSETAISIVDDASHTHPMMDPSRRDLKPYPSPTSLSAGSGSAPKATDSGRYKIPTESNRTYSFVSKKPATALSICPSAEQIILSFDAGMLSLKLKRFDSNPVLNFDIDIIQSNKNGQAAWKHVHTAGEYLVVRGFNNEPVSALIRMLPLVDPRCTQKGNYKHVLSRPAFSPRDICRSLLLPPG
jgi:serine/threonine protein kinase